MLRRLIGSERSQSMVEFVLVVPIFLVLVFGIIDFGRAFYTVHDLAAATREGARYAAVLDDPAGRADEVRAVGFGVSVVVGGLERAEEDRGKLVIREKLTQADVASRVGASREMVSRILKDLALGGYISAKHKCITIHKVPPPHW